MSNLKDPVVPVAPPQDESHDESGGIAEARFCVRACVVITMHFHCHIYDG